MTAHRSARRRKRLRKLVALTGAAAGVAAVRNRALASNERRYADRLGLDDPGSKPGSPPTTG